jgi:hypothetical protein
MASSGVSKETQAAYRKRRNIGGEWRRNGEEISAAMKNQRHRKKYQAKIEENENIIGGNRQWHNGQGRDAPRTRRCRALLRAPLTHRRA